MLTGAARRLALDPVHCVGGTWLMQRGEPVDRAAITAAAREAAGLAG